MNQMPLNDITSRVIHEAMIIHKEIGPGLLEKMYHKLLCAALIDAGLKITTEFSPTFIYRGFDLGDACRFDIVVNDQVLIEVKAVEEIHSVHYAQVNTYLLIGNLPLGLLLNFNSALMKTGIRRIINTRHPLAGELRL
jgi:GxxExxY protein